MQDLLLVVHKLCFALPDTMSYILIPNLETDFFSYFRFHCMLFILYELVLLPSYELEKNLALKVFLNSAISKPSHNVRRQCCFYGQYGSTAG